MRLWSASLRYAWDDGLVDCTKRLQKLSRTKKHVCMITLITWGKHRTHFKDFSIFTEDGCNFWQSYFKCRRVTWRAFSVESLFPRLLYYSLCSDMFLSPSPKFPSFRERSKARDCDLPWGWVKDSPHPPFLERWAVPPHLFILYTPESLIFPWINWLSADRADVSSFQPYFGLSGQINKCSTAGSMDSLCRQKKEGKKTWKLYWSCSLK